MSRQMLLPESFVLDVLKLIYQLEDYDNMEELQPLTNRIYNTIAEKCKAREKREAFTAYKSAAPMSNERECARQVYLDKAHIHKNWRGENEAHPR